MFPTDPSKTYYNDFLCNNTGLTPTRQEVADNQYYAQFGSQTTAQNEMAHGDLHNSISNYQDITDTPEFWELNFDENPAFHPIRQREGDFKRSEGSDTHGFSELNFDDIASQNLNVPLPEEPQDCQSDSTAPTILSSDSTDNLDEEHLPIDYRPGTSSMNGKVKKAQMKCQISISPDKTKILSQYFKKNRTPDSDERTRLAYQLNISPQKIANWFRNHRYVARKKERKQAEKISSSTDSFDYFK